jgi:hypothetical protein
MRVGLHSLLRAVSLGREAGKGSRRQVIEDSLSATGHNPHASHCLRHYPRRRPHTAHTMRRAAKHQRVTNTATCPHRTGLRPRRIQHPPARPVGAACSPAHPSRRRGSRATQVSPDSVTSEEEVRSHGRDRPRRHQRHAVETRAPGAELLPDARLSGLRSTPVRPTEPREAPQRRHERGHASGQ